MESSKADEKKYQKEYFRQAHHADIRHSPHPAVALAAWKLLTAVAWVS
jgi:hypothetical protein